MALAPSLLIEMVCCHDLGEDLEGRGPGYRLIDVTLAISDGSHIVDLAVTRWSAFELEDGSWLMER